MSPKSLKVGQLFFAYGCFLDPQHLAQVVGMPLASGWAARLAGWRLAFNISDEDGALVASIVEAQGCCVYGVVYRLPRDALAALDKYEGVPDWYRRETCWVEPLGRAARQSVLVYVGQEGSTVEEGNPEPAYLELLTTGAEIHGLPGEYVEWLRSHSQGRTQGCYSDGGRN